MSKRYIAVAISLAAASLSACNRIPSKDLPDATKEAIAQSGKAANGDLNSDAVAALIDQKNPGGPIYVGIVVGALDFGNTYSYQTDKVVTCLALGESLRTNNFAKYRPETVITCNNASGRPLIRFACQSGETCKPG